VLTTFLRRIRGGEVCGTDVWLQAGMHERAFILSTSERPQAQQGRDTTGFDDPLAAAGADE
jgi:hypothetical protein